MASSLIYLVAFTKSAVPLQCTQGQLLSEHRLGSHFSLAILNIYRYVCYRQRILINLSIDITFGKAGVARSV
jgi:hypothetical protein